MLVLFLLILSQLLFRIFFYIGIPIPVIMKNENLQKKLFVDLIPVAVFYCRYVIDKDIVESFYK